MVGGTRIIAFGGKDTPEDTSSEVEATLETAPEIAEIAEVEEQEEAVAPARGLDWLAPALALLAIAGWTGFFLWARQDQLSPPVTPAAWTRLIADWGVPVLLICTGWLLFMRNSRREAARFGDAARLLSSESARLESRLITVNRELSLAREFIASQSRDLEALGRIATERLSVNAEQLRALIHDNGARIDSIGSVSQAALENMEKLRGQLPVIASSAKDVTNNIGNAGRAAASQLDEMISGFRRLNDFGQASERQVEGLRSRIDDALAELGRQSEQLEAVATARFAALAEQGTALRTQLDTHEVEALAAIRSRASALASEVEETRQQLDRQEEDTLTSLRARLSALRDESSAMSRAIRDDEGRAVEGWRATAARVGEDIHAAIVALEGAEAKAVQNARSRLEALGHDAIALEEHLVERNQRFEAEMGRRIAAFEAGDQQAIARLSQRLATLDAEIAERRSGHERQAAAIDAHCQAIAGRLSEVELHLTQVAARGGEAEASFNASAQALADTAAESRAVLVGTDREITGLTEASVRLLELLQASRQQAGGELPQALAASEGTLAALEGRIAALREAVAETGRQGETLSGLIATSGSDLRSTFGEIEQLQAALGRNNAGHGEVLAELRATLVDIEQRSGALIEQSRGELSEAITTLLASANTALATLSETGSRTASDLARQLSEESAGAIDKAMRTSAAETAGQLELAAAHAAGVSREAAIQLRDQLAKVNELVGNLERRVAHARQRAEEQVDNDFARRAALITESLNSNAIDIAKALTTDVSETAWTSYLRGDRGFFTRRAVTLIQSGEAKAIAQIYENDADFREHVSRYIHDFEAILRQVLSTRDGQALGVTLLSSDMGKLYVALAQAIERLRG